MLAATRHNSERRARNLGAVRAVRLDQDNMYTNLKRYHQRIII